MYDIEGNVGCSNSKDSLGLKPDAREVLQYILMSETFFHLEILWIIMIVFFIIVFVLGVLKSSDSI